MDYFSTDGNARNIHALTNLMRPVYALIYLLASAQIGLADGGAVQLRATAPPFVVTVFTDPPQCRAGQVDLSMLVQEEKEPVLDAEVIVSLSPLEPVGTRRNGAWFPPACANYPATDLQNIPLQIAQGTNRLFYSALVQIPHDGPWQVQATLRRGADHATVQGIIEVEPALPPVTAYWQWFLLPFLAIGAFVLHQHIRKHPRRSSAAL